MIGRWIANGIVVLGFGYLGLLFAARLDSRVREIETIEKMLTQLSFYIGFLSLPMAEAIQRTAQGQQGSIRLLLDQINDFLQEYPHLPMDEAWEEAVRRHHRKFYLKEEEIQILLDFSKHLGMGDKETVLNQIRLTNAKLKLVGEEAKMEREERGKLYRGIGFLSGMLVVILLL